MRELGIRDSGSGIRELGITDWSERDTVLGVRSLNLKFQIPDSKFPNPLSLIANIKFQIPNSRVPHLGSHVSNSRFLIP